eukprot:3202796-Amphidinium_carterae.1
MRSWSLQRARATMQSLYNCEPTKHGAQDLSGNSLPEFLLRSTPFLEKRRGSIFSNWQEADGLEGRRLVHCVGVDDLAPGKAAGKLHDRNPETIFLVPALI